jgi:hypothetical protein
VQKNYVYCVLVGVSRVGFFFALLCACFAFVTPWIIFLWLQELTGVVCRADVEDVSV